jgi:hypothetical protein
MPNIDELIHDLNDFISRVNSGKGIDRAVAAKSCAESIEVITDLDRLLRGHGAEPQEVETLKQNYDELIKALRKMATGECYQVIDADGNPMCGCDHMAGEAADAIIALRARADHAEQKCDECKQRLADAGCDDVLFEN